MQLKRKLKKAQGIPLGMIVCNQFNIFLILYVQYINNLCYFSVPEGLKNLKVAPQITEFEEIDITKALTTPGRLLYPKIAKKSRLDEFLTRRTHLKILEERKIAQQVMYLLLAILVNLFLIISLFLPSSPLLKLKTPTRTMKMAMLM